MNIIVNNLLVMYFCDSHLHLFPLWMYVFILGNLCTFLSNFTIFSVILNANYWDFMCISSIPLDYFPWYQYSKFPLTVQFYLLFKLVIYLSISSLLNLHIFIVHRADFHNGYFVCAMSPLTMTSFYIALFSHCFLPFTQHSEWRSMSHFLLFPPFQYSLFSFVFHDLFHLVFCFTRVKSLLTFLQ